MSIMNETILIPGESDLPYRPDGPDKSDGSDGPLLQFVKSNKSMLKIP